MRALALCLALAASATAQPAPAVDAYDLLGATFYPRTGVFSASDAPLTAVFPTDGAYTLALLDADGGVAASTPLQAQPLPHAPAFAHLTPGRFTYEPTPGDFRLAVLLDGDVIGAVPFTLSRTQSDDPFDPVTTWAIDGPWRTTGVLWAPTDDADAEVELTYWIHPEEVSRSGAKVRAVLTRDGRRVSTQEREWSVFTSSPGWQERTHTLNDADGGRRSEIRRSELADGDYRIEIGEDGAAPIRTFRFAVADGQFVPHARSALDHTPRADFLTPRSLRRVDNSERYPPVDQVWMVSE